MGHKQPYIPIIIDNLTADRIINSRIQQKHTKAMEMRFHWLCNREVQEQFPFFWHLERDGIKYYWAKYHSAEHHKRIRSELLTFVEKIGEMRNQLNRPETHSAKVC